MLSVRISSSLKSQLDRRKMEAALNRHKQLLQILFVVFTLVSSSFQPVTAESNNNNNKRRHQAFNNNGAFTAASQRRNFISEPISEIMAGNQCPNLAAASGMSSLMAPASSSANNRVKVDEQTKERSFNARIVGIFSCLDSDSASNDLTLDFRLAKPVVDLAIQAANRKYSPQVQFNVTYRTAPDICRHQQAAGHAADEYYVNGANYFVGPGCSESLASVGQLASYWNVPICSTGYLPEVVTARFHPLTLMQLSLSVESVGEMLLEMFQMYRWRHLVIVTDEKHPLHSAIRDGLLEFFHTLYMRSSPDAVVGGPAPAAQQQQQSGRDNVSSATPTGAGRHQFMSGAKLENVAGQQQQQARHGGAQSGAGKTRVATEPYHINITSLNFAYAKNKPIDYEQVMLDAAAYSRIMLLLARSSTIGDLLAAAHQQGMSRGQFVFIAHELFETQMFGQRRPSSSAHRQQQHQSTNISSSSSSTNSSNSRGHEQSGATFALSDKIEILRTGGNASSEQLTREIFHPLMTISLRIPTTPEFDLFRSEVAGLSEREFNYRIQPSSLKSLYSLGVAAFIYDCVMLYADKVNFVLNQTQFSKIDGQTIFELTAGRTFSGALTGDLTINRAGQRVIDFTLNDFSPRSLSLEPIAHFVAIERRLQFLPGKQPHWVGRNQSVPRSDPRCRINDTIFCRYSELDSDADSTLANGGGPGVGGHAGSSSFVLAVWLLTIIVVSVALTSSIIGYLVYRRFRIESELLNLWWSIKYEDILFEDEPDVMCDGKRSMSSLAISNESFNESARQTQEATAGGGQLSRAASPHQSPGSASLKVAAANRQQLDAMNRSAQDQVSAAGSQLQLSPSGQDVQSAAAAAAAGALSAAHSSSTLSVTAPSIVARAEPTGGAGAGANQQAASSSNMATHRHQGNHRSPINQGASRLIPLLNKAGSGGGGGTRGAVPSGSGKFSGSSVQLGGQAPAGKGRSGTGVGRAGDNAASATGCAGQNNFKDPSISSQNKNVKLRLGTVLNGGRDDAHTTKVGLYKASRVAAKHLNVKNLNINRQLLIELRQVRDLTHENLIKFIGLCPDEPNVAIVSELCTRGNLQDLLQNDTIRLDWPFRYSIMNDIVDGLIHLHSSPIAYHGRLKSSNCVIDNRFVVKLTDFGLPTLLAAVEELDENVNPRLLLWTAPEHLRTKRPLLSGSQKGDIYSLAIIFQEIITRCGPFECEPILCGASQVGVPIDWQASQATQQQQQQQQQQMQPPVIRALDAGGKPLTQHGNRRGGGGNRAASSAPAFIMPGTMPVFQPIVVQHKQRLEPEEIVNLVRMGLSPPFRPYFRPDVATAGGSGAGATGDFNVGELIGIVQNCWQEVPAQRPNVQNVKQQIKKMRRGFHLEGANLMDNLLQRMERYTDNLESLVEQKTAELTEEKKRSEELLYEMLPRFVVDQLKYGHSVTPEAYEAVTISFSDIKDFTGIAAQSSPIEVVNLLNQLYTEFDDCIDQYDVYKVETIGDAYMVVSGLPIRNGDQHAREIADLSLDLLDLIGNFDVAHLPHVQLELRIGIHSGPCASGVVGTRMFRYCLFGDTVNTASRMESHGEPMKIHISEESANILERFGCFLIESRGQVDIKGKGIMNTYWLTGRVDAAAAADAKDSQAIKAIAAT